MDRAQEIGLFRWQIVGEATDLSLSARERGRLVRALAEREHLAPDGRRVRVARTRWIGGSARIVRAGLTGWSRPRDGREHHA